MRNNPLTALLSITTLFLLHDIAPSYEQKKTFISHHSWQKMTRTLCRRQNFSRFSAKNKITYKKTVNDTGKKASVTIKQVSRDKASQITAEKKKRSKQQFAAWTLIRSCQSSDWCRGRLWRFCASEAPRGFQKNGFSGVIAPREYTRIPPWKTRFAYAIG